MEYRSYDFSDYDFYDFYDFYNFPITIFTILGLRWSKFDQFVLLQIPFTSPNMPRPASIKGGIGGSQFGRSWPKMRFLESARIGSKPL